MRALISVPLLLAALSSFAANPAVTINVDANANRNAIDPRIYGASWASANEITQLGLTLNRWGGNAMSRYNWTYATANRCKDYFFYNIPEGGSNGASADNFIIMTRNAGAHPVMTIPMLSLLPENATKQCSFPQSMYPNQEQFSTFEPITCGNGRLQDNNGIVGDGPRILGNPDPNNIATSYPLSHQGDWVQHMIDAHGNSAAGGMRYYSLDNEPGLWSADHWDVHPTGTSYDEAWAKMEELGAIIRSKDAAAVITGGEEWGWSGYFMSGLDVENGNNADRDAHGGKEWYDWMLEQFAAYEAEHGERILDVLTVHFYPQSGEFWSGSVSNDMQLLRNRSTRSLWDPNYVDESWISDTCWPNGCKVQLIPRLKEWVADHYPGTQIGITEYNWGDVDHINGATTQADILGIFGREGLNLGIRWEAPGVNTFEGSAFKIYRNYDGAGSKFGDISVSATGTNADEVAVFASERSSDNALTVMIINKVLSDTTPATVNLANFTHGRTVQRWQLTSASRNIAHLSDLTISSPMVSLTLPAQSITLLVIPKGTVPDPPLPDQAVPGHGSATIHFEPPANDGGWDITSYTVTCTGGFNASGPASPITVNGLTNGQTHFCTVTATNALGTSEASQPIMVTPQSNAPVLTATASSTSQINLTWTAVANATGYEVWRSFNNSGFSLRTTTGPSTTAFSDGGLTANTAYLYRVRALFGASAPGNDSVIDPAVTILFTDDVLTTIKIVHFAQLRTAVNALRASAALAPQVFTDDPLTTSTKIKGIHISQIRNALSEARSAIGLPAISWTDGFIAPPITKAKAVHVHEVRNGVR
jgi:Glycoside hydrolase family 44